MLGILFPRVLQVLLIMKALPFELKFQVAGIVLVIKNEPLRYKRYSVTSGNRKECRNKPDSEIMNDSLKRRYIRLLLT